MSAKSGWIWNVEQASSLFCCQAGGTPAPLQANPTEFCAHRIKQSGFAGKTVWVTVVALVMVVLTPVLLANTPYVVSPSTGERILGRGIRRNEDGEILLRTENAELTFPADSVIYVPEPPEYGRAVNLLQQRNYDSAIDVLEQLMAKYANLQWDKRARVLLAGAWVDKKNFAKAAEIYAEVAREDSPAFDDETVLFRYLEALRQSGREADFLTAIRDTIRNRSRRAAARAQILRGRLQLQKNAVEDGLLDFLRTAEMFVDVEEVREEAVARTARAFEKLNDPRAVAFFARLKREYPDSRFLER